MGEEDHDPETTERPLASLDQLADARHVGERKCHLDLFDGTAGQDCGEESLGEPVPSLICRRRRFGCPARSPRA
jgi:hypothetical protein